jgi:hypothetical protein
MADLKISELAALAGADLAAGDLLPVADISASETKKLTISDAIGYGVTLIADATIPGAKILFNAGGIAGDRIADGGISATQIAADAVTGIKLADGSTCQLLGTLPAAGDYVGQLALDTDDNKLYLWGGSTWIGLKAAGSINTVLGSTTGPVNVVVVTAGDTVTVSATLDASTAAGQFLAGPTSGAGAVELRTIAATDLPLATTSAIGAVQVNGEGLRMDGNRIEINNDVTASASYQVVTYDAKGLITAGRAITSADIPVATSGAVGSVRPGTGLSVTADGDLNHTNAVTGATATKITYDAQGHVTAGANLVEADIPNLPASKITTGTLSVSLLGSNSITGAKLGNASTVQFGGAGSTAGVVSFPVAEFKGQYFWDELNGDLYIWSGSAWLPVTITSGELVYGGTYDASVNQVSSVTSAGSAAGLVVGAALPAASTTNNRYYVVVGDAGTGTGNAPAEALAPPDMILSNGATWDLIDVSSGIGGQIASNITFTPYGAIAATNVQAALQELDDEKLPKAGGTITGAVLVGTGGSIGFEGSTDDAYETYLAVVDPTADRTITFPDASGTVVLSGAIVDADIAAGAAISFSKLAALTSGHILVGNGSNAAASVAMSGDVTISNAGVTTVVTGSTSTAGKLQLTDSTSSTSTTTAATPNAVKTTYDLANAALARSGGTMTGTITFAAGQTISGYAALATVQSFTAAQRGAITTLTDGATITPDFAAANNYTVTLGGNRTLANPSNLTAGQSGVIYIVQDGTGSRTLAYGSQYDFEGGTAPTLSTAANSVDALVYTVRTTGSILCRLLKAFS